MVQRASWGWRTGVATAIAFAVCTPARGHETGDAGARPEQRSRDILVHIDAPPNEPGWIARYVALDYQSGFRISRAVSFGSRRLDLRLRGPVFKTPVRSKNYGLKLELKF